MWATHLSDVGPGCYKLIFPLQNILMTIASWNSLNQDLFNLSEAFMFSLNDSIQYIEEIDG